MIDGFTLNPHILDAEARYAFDAVTQLRRFSGRRILRPRWHCIPPQLAQTIPAQDVFSHQVQLIPGTLVYGINFHAITGNLADYHLDIIDTYRQMSITQNAVFATAYAVNGSPIRPVLFAIPKVVEGSGLWQVKISNSAAIPQQAQMILYCAEPVGDFV